MNDSWMKQMQKVFMIEKKIIKEKENKDISLLKNNWRKKKQKIRKLFLKIYWNSNYLINNY